MNFLSPLRDVSVAILSCNRREELRTTLTGLLVHGPVWHEIVVADNASTDGTAAMIRQDFPGIRLIETGSNRGVAGINRAYRESSGRWVLSLDDDSCPDLESWPALCAALASHPAYAAITCSVRATPIGFRPTTPPLIPYIGFHQAGGLLRRDLIERLGGFDEDLFLWGVELHLVARAVHAGFNTARCDSAVVVHRATPINRSSRRHAYHYCRNIFLLVLRHAPADLQRELTDSYLARVLLNSVLHRTTAYLAAIQDAVRIHRRTHFTAPLSAQQFREMNPDLRSAFAFLG